MVDILFLWKKMDRQGMDYHEFSGATMIHCGSDLVKMDDGSTTSKTEGRTLFSLQIMVTYN